MTIDDIVKWRDSIDDPVLLHCESYLLLAETIDFLITEVERLTADRNLEKLMRKRAENSLAQLQKEVAQWQR